MLLTGNAEVDKKIKQSIAGDQKLNSSHQVMVEWNYNAYTPILEIGCFYLNRKTYKKDPHYGGQAYYYSDDVTELDKNRETYTPLRSIFDINRPKAGIIHSVYMENRAINGEPDAAKSLSIKDMFNISADHPRLYPLSKDSVFKYWSSVRTSELKVVGLSEKDYTINYAAPYIEYSDPIYINKVVVKTQKHLGYATSFRVDVKTSFDDKDWETIYSDTSSESLLNGELNIYYDYENNKWTIHSNVIDQPDEKSVIDFSKTESHTKKIYGLRFIARKMSKTYIPLEMIELSPRLVADLTSSTTSFEVSSSVSGSAYGLPIGSVISSNGSITLSNENGYFSKKNTNSIIANVLKPNVEMRLYQKLVVDGKTYRFPLKTLYTDLWNEEDGFTVSTQLEDYFKFFKEQKAPDIMIANKNGIPTSAAMLIFMDNIGFNNFRFEKVDSSQYIDDEDIVLDFFYSKKEQTVMEVIESLAISTQTAIYMDVDNDLVAMTKEKMISGQYVKDFCMTGDKNSHTKSSFYDGTETTTIKYISNIESFQESLEPPITDITVQYNGLGFQKQSVALVGTGQQQIKENQDFLESPTFGASTTNENLRYSLDILWQPGNDKNSSDSYLAAAALIEEVPDTGPYKLLLNSKALSSKYTDYNKENVIKKLANSTNDSLRKAMCIYLDKQYINTFKNSFSGYVLIDAELIKYYGIVYVINDPINKSLYREVLFSIDQYQAARAKLGQGGSIQPEALVLDLDFTYYESTNNSAQKDFNIVGDGRGQNRTKITAHKAINTHKDFLLANTDWHRNGTNLWGSTKSLSRVIVNNLTVTDRKETYLSTKTMHYNSIQQSFSGHLRLSGPKCSNIIKSTKEYKASVKALIPTSNSSEQIITGIVKTVKNVNGKNMPIHKIGTRMRLVSDVPKNVNPGDKPINEGIIAGVGWSIGESPHGTGMTGYFLEIEDVGTIDPKSLHEAKYRNMRLYRVDSINGKLIPSLLGNSWVNASHTPQIGLDWLRSPADAKTSHSQIFDLEIIIKESGKYKEYQVFWENQNVLTINELASKALETSNVCLFVRGESSAIYEHLYVASSPYGINLKNSTDINIDYLSGNKDMSSRGYLPTGVTKLFDVDGKPMSLYFEEFGRFVREVKKFDVRFSKPNALKPQLLTLSGINTNYCVSDFEVSSNGASFWLYNTSNGPIQLSDSTATPLSINGYPLVQVSPSSIQSSKLLEREDYSKALDDEYELNRKIYGKQELQLSGEFINNRAQAEKLAKWIGTKLKKERKTLNLSIFPNPILKLGDKVGVAYEAKYYEGSESYTITSINHSISNNGPAMNIELKECV